MSLSPAGYPACGGTSSAGPWPSGPRAPGASARQSSCSTTWPRSARPTGPRWVGRFGRTSGGLSARPTSPTSPARTWRSPPRARRGEARMALPRHQPTLLVSERAKLPTMWRVGVDSGGTFTDICLVDETSGEVRVWKVPSTPADPSRAIALGAVEGLREAAHGAAADVSYFGHGTTVATNALIQHRGATTGLITTEGFRDLLEIGRQRRPHLYDLQADKPPVLVPRALRLEVAERMRHDGHLATPLDEEQVRAAVRQLERAGAQAIAVCFLYCYVDPRHEQAVRRIVEAEYPDVFVTCSHEVAPQFREYERLSTVVVNAYLGPVMAGYLARLGPRLAEAGVRVPPHITQSNGGVMSFETARAQPVRAVLSGPATGVVGGLEVGRLAGLRHLITFDMGGTSTDVSLVADGRPVLAGEMEVHGYPLKTPALDIHTVGAGGGSIAHVDRGGLLKVGPRSAGAQPGPVCYGLGNDEPTVTDANVVLGTLNPEHLLAGRMKIDRARAEAAIG